MTAPRPVQPGATYLVTRRCTQRQYLLAPSPRVRQAILYCLAEAAEKHNIVVHCITVMSNHYHATISDPGASYPAFLRRFHQHVAKVLNTLYDREENAWASEQSSVVRLVEPRDHLEKMIYTLVNPVAAGLVERVKQWPGVCSLGWQLSGQEVVVERPDWFFREAGPLPERVSLRLARPPGFEHFSDVAWRELLLSAVRKREAALAIERVERGVTVLGRKAILARRPDGRPKTRAPRGRLRPTIACRNKARRIAVLERNAAWRAAYRSAFEALVAGDREAVFPMGTYKRRLEGCRCAARDGPSAFPRRFAPDEGRAPPARMASTAANPDAPSAGVAGGSSPGF